MYNIRDLKRTWIMKLKDWESIIFLDLFLERRLACTKAFSLSKSQMFQNKRNDLYWTQDKKLCSFNLMVLFPYRKALEIDPSVWVFIALHFPSGPIQMKPIHKVQPKETQSLKSLGKRAGLQRIFWIYQSKKLFQAEGASAKRYLWN